MRMCIVINMPTKNVYIAEADLPLFEQAARLAGGNSAAVVAGIRLYLEHHGKKGQREMMGTVELEVDDGPVVRTKRFTGRLCLKWRRRVEGLRVQTFRVYATAKGQYAVHTRDDPDWTGMGSRDWDSAEADGADGTRTWEGEWWRPRERSLLVFPDAASMRGRLPDGLVDEVERMGAGPQVEDLDI